ncbi:MAG: putative bifunctional diguanylate cyclase/phosphodiesterase [Gemmatimonadota bacterium]
MGDRRLMAFRGEEGGPAGSLAEETVHGLLDSMADGVLLVDDEGRIAYANSRLSSLLGYRRSELLGESLEILVPGELRQTHRHQRAAYLAAPAGRPMGTGLDLHAVRKDGETVPVDISLSPIRSEGRTFVMAVIRDLTEQMRLAEALQASERRYHELFEHNTAGAFRSGLDGRILECNPAFARMFGYDSVEEVEGRPAAMLYTRPEDREVYLERLRREGAVENYELEMRCHDGSPMWVLAHSVLLEDPESGEETIMGTVIDLSPRKLVERELERMAYRDTLTGLPSRKLLEIQAERALARAARCEGRAGLLYVDLRRFRRINDSLGHDAGDRILVEVARRMRRGCRESDSLARVGSDEFAVLMPEVDGPEDALTTAGRIRQSLASPLRVGERSVRVEASIGIALHPEHGRRFGELLKCAHRAARGAAAAETFIEVFSPERTGAGIDELDREEEVRRALAEKQFVLLYQPIRSLAAGELHGVEALVRWQHPDRGLLSPDEFVPFAERCGLIAELDRWVLQTAMRQAAGWREPGHPAWISVNCSAASVADPELVEYVDDVLGWEGVEGARLAIEVTERVAMRDPVSAAERLRALGDRGVRTMIDDFGTGHSSLSYLKHLPVRALKVDRSFVADVTQDPKDEALIRAIIGLAHGLGLEVIAEGVEDRAQRDWLASVGCDYAQGFLVGRPVPAEKI